MATSQFTFRIDPAHFQVDVEALLELNDHQSESMESVGDSTQLKPCILCGSSSYQKCLNLNNGLKVCEDCTEFLKKVKYPESSERRRREYVERSRKRELAVEKIRSHWLIKGRNIFFAGGFTLLVASYFQTKVFLFAVCFILLGIALLILVRMLQKNWNKRFPEIEKPVVNAFSDPNAELTEFDRKCLRVFEHWPGYPPFWNDLAKAVRKRDQNRCQVTGCPSLLELHVHHREMISQGGAHTADNLVTLCAFHHGVEPEEGHFQILEKFKNPRFTMIPTHRRHNPVNRGTHRVEAHVRRLQLATNEQIRNIIQTYAMRCPQCESYKSGFDISPMSKALRIVCGGCGQGFSSKNCLPEEIGPQMAAVLIVGQNRGRWSRNSNKTRSPPRPISVKSAPPQSQQGRSPDNNGKEVE